VPGSRLALIGTGPYEKELKEFFSQEEDVLFLGIREGAVIHHTPLTILETDSSTTCKECFVVAGIYAKSQSLSVHYSN
jgi:hypothetical protein